MKSKKRVSKSSGKDDINLILGALLWAALISLAIANADAPVKDNAKPNPVTRAEAAKFL